MLARGPRGVIMRFLGPLERGHRELTRRPVRGHMAAPERFITPTLPKRSHRTRLRRARDFIRHTLGRVRVERRDLIVVGVLLALLIVLLLTRFSDRFFDSAAGRRPGDSAPISDVSLTGQ